MLKLGQFAAQWLGVLIVLAPFLTSAQSVTHDQSLGIVPTATSAVNDFPLRFRGYYAINNRLFVSVSSGEQAVASWVPLGGRHGNLTLREISEDRDQLTVEDETGELHEVLIDVVRFGHSLDVADRPDIVRLPLSSVTPLPPKAAPLSEADVVVYPSRDAPRSEEGLNWKWILSAENPMPSLESTRNVIEKETWLNMSDEERSSMVEIYRQCGYHLSVINGPGVFGQHIGLIKPPPHISTAQRPLLNSHGKVMSPPED